MKISNFSEDRCRSLLSLPRYSVIYENGKKYFEKIEPGKDDLFYKVATTGWVIKRCKDIWYYDSTGWIRDEERALDEFLERVEKGRELKVEEAEEPLPMKEKLLYLGIFLIVVLIVGGLYTLNNIYGWGIF